MSPRSPIRRWLQARTGWLLVIVPTALAALANPSPLERLDLLLYDSLEPLVAPAPAAEPPAVIVAIDEPSLAALGRWPWDRDVHGRLLDRLGEADAAAVGMSILFAEPGAPIGLACRRYPVPGGHEGAPTLDQLRGALADA